MTVLRWGIDWYSLYILSIVLVLRKLSLKVYFYSHIFTFLGGIFCSLFIKSYFYKVVLEVLIRLRKMIL